MNDKGWEAYLRWEIREMESVVESMQDGEVALPDALKRIIQLELQMRKLMQAWQT
ncbi:MAG TPA: hypothetical protein VMU17_06625 [Elusimicrobiota bacterium]|nr:hypothetical protein [Elusimicrobiota bacterium]